MIPVHVTIVTPLVLLDTCASLTSAGPRILVESLAQRMEVPCLPNEALSRLDGSRLCSTSGREFSACGGHRAQDLQPLCRLVPPRLSLKVRTVTALAFGWWHLKAT